MLFPEIKRVWQANVQVYGADKVWKQMNAERIAVARGTVERLMKRLGLRGGSSRHAGPDDDSWCHRTASAGSGE